METPIDPLPYFVMHVLTKDGTKFCVRAHSYNQAVNIVRTTPEGERSLASGLLGVGIVERAD